MSWTEFASIFQNLSIGIAALGTAYIAYKGLGTWREQLRGSANFETARSLAKSTYRLREAVQRARSPFISAAEFPPGYSAVGSKTSREEADAYIYVFRNRWQPISEALQEFEVYVLEAEALWGNQVRSTSGKLLHVINQLNGGIHTLIEDKVADGQLFHNDREFGVRIRQTVFGQPNDLDNKTTQELRKAIEAIDDLARPHLSRY